MKAFIQAEIEAEAVIQAMFEDSGFALEMWKELSEKLNMGLLLDECMDLTREGFSLNEKQMFAGSLQLMADCLSGQIEWDEASRAANT